MSIRIFQANVNRSKPSLDLLMHQARENGAGVLLVTESNYIPDSHNWYVGKQKCGNIYRPELS